tara:strand:+ start:126 stop:440 length:315 start_codon:yes stop_codon:yes gene_type:complete
MIKKINLKKIITDVVSEYYNLSSKDLYAKSRKGMIPSARAVVFYILNLNGFSVSEIAEEFKKDRSTVVQMKHKASYERDEDIELLKTIINNHLNSIKYEYNNNG